MNELSVFKNEEFGEIRTVIIENEPMFCLSDVCKALGLTQPSKVKERLNEKGVSSIPTLTAGGEQKLLYINESNLYKTIFQSRKESAERFTEWVTYEVLPSIRKTGGYNRPLTLEEQLQIVARGTLEVKEEIKRLDSEFQDFKNDMPLLAIEIDKITEAVKKKGVAVLGGKNSNAYKNSSLRTKLYQDLHRDVRRQFGVSTYKAIKRNQCEQVLAMVDSYKPPIFLDALISNENSQMSIAL